MARIVWQTPNQEALQLSRKVFFFKDPDTDEMLTHFMGIPVEPIIYHYQLVSYSYTGEQIQTAVSARCPYDLPSITNSNRQYSKA